ncbi:MAG: lyase family protein [Spirochaetales bacterium]|nr:lyase family protein [Spirochaetales bacterium]
MKLFGEETKKALAWLGQGHTPRPLIRAYGEVKRAALRAQQETAHPYPEDYFSLLEETLEEIIRGDHDESFPLPLAQGGAGTSLHMNLCETAVLITDERYNGPFRAHPLDHLARFQSTNDTFPTAVILMTYRFLEETEKNVVALQEALTIRENRYEEWLMCGRTELQDGLPITLGQVFGAWAGPVERDRWRLNKVKERLRTIPLGGTAVGTGFSAPREYVFAAEKQLRRLTGLPLCRSQNLCDGTAHTDSLAEAAQSLGLCGDNLYKMASDLLLYGMGSLGEIRHGEMQYGSTIMAGKTNPVCLELIRGLTMECRSLAGLIGDYSRSGQWQLNANLPFLAEQIIRLSERLNRALCTAHGPLMEILEPQKERLERNFTTGPALINTLRSCLDYSLIKEFLPQLVEQDFSSREELIQFLTTRGGLKEEELREKLTTYRLTGFTQGESR